MLKSIKHTCPGSLSGKPGPYCGSDAPRTTGIFINKKFSYILFQFYSFPDHFHSFLGSRTGGTNIALPVP